MAKGKEMSDDDLDAFFDEVEEVEQEIKTKQPDKEKETDASAVSQPDHEDNNEPPSKKVKVEPPLNVEKLKGNVLAGRGTAVISKKAEKSRPNTNEIYQILVPESGRQQPLTQPINLPTTTSTIPQIPSSLGVGQEDLKVIGKPAVRVAAGKTWVDNILAQFPLNDFRLFVGNLGSDVTEQKLAEAFQSRYPSFAMARIVYDKTTGESKGYGFVSVMDPKDCAKAIREMNQSWLGSRPIKVQRSDWKERDLKEVRKKQKKRR